MSLRTTSGQKELIGRAAEIKQETVSDFVLRSATEAAERALADKVRFELSPDGWNRFAELLDRPAVEKPRLAKLLSNTDKPK